MSLKIPPYQIKIRLDMIVFIQFVDSGDVELFSDRIINFHAISYTTPTNGYTFLHCVRLGIGSNMGPILCARKKLWRRDGKVGNSLVWHFTHQFIMSGDVVMLSC